MIDEGLRQFATETQSKYMDAINKHGSLQKAANATGVGRAAVKQAMARLRKAAAVRGYSPEHDMTHIAPDGFGIKRHSKNYDGDGQLRQEWVIMQPDAKNLELMQESILAGMSAEIEGGSTPVKAPVSTYENMMTVYPMGDPHIGMYCWAAESGNDFDSEIATTQLTDAMRRLVAVSPPSKYALIANLGDFFHSDTLDNQTRRSGHALDVDTRMSKVWELGMKALITCIDEAKSKHELVTIRNEIGNHDDHTSMLLSIALDAWYKNDERVHVDRSPAKFYYLKFGKCLIGTTHGDTAKIPKLPGIMAADQPENWGKTLHRYWYTGHFHSSKVEEYPGVLVEQFRTLAAKDAWTAGAGYRAGRDMRCIVLNSEFGEVERHRVDIQQIEAAA